MERTCYPLCSICRSPGPAKCAATFRALAEEAHEEQVSANHDAVRARWRAERAKQPARFSTVTMTGYDAFGRPTSASGDPVR